MRLLFLFLVFLVSCTPSSEEFLQDLFSALNDQEYVEDYGYDIDCLDPEIASRKELPSGIYPPELITQRNEQWNCDGNRFKFFSNGLVEAVLTLDDLEFALAVENQCGIEGTRFGYVLGDWIGSENTYDVCIRYRILQGKIICANLEDGNCYKETLF